MPQDATDATGCSSQITKFECVNSRWRQGGIESAPGGGLDLKPTHDQQLIENRDFNRLKIKARG
jgi:hypothetical protein